MQFTAIKIRPPAKRLLLLVLTSCAFAVVWVWAGGYIIPFPTRHAFTVWIVTGWVVYAILLAWYELRRLRKFRNRYHQLLHVEKQNLKLKRIQEIIMAMSHTIPVKDLLHMIIRYAHEVTDAFFVTVSTVNWPQRTVKVVASTATDNALIQKGLSLLNLNLQGPLPLGDAEERYRAERITTTDRAAELSGSLFPSSLIDKAQKLVGMKRMVEIPLRVEDDIYGFIIFVFRHRNIDQEILITFANQCAQALKKAERIQELDEKERYLQNIIDDFADAVIQLDKAGNIERWNQGAARMFGYARDELNAKPLSLLLGISTEQYMKAMTPQKYYANFEASATRKDAKCIITNVTLTARFGSDGEISGYTGIVRDIDNEKRIRNEINLLARIVEHSSNSIVIADSDTHVVYCNRKAAEMLGYTKPEMIDLPMKSILTTRDHDLDKILHQVTQGSYWDGEAGQIRKDGEVLPVLQNIFLIRDEVLDKANLVFIATDILQLKAKEAEVGTKTAQLSKINTELIKSNIELKRLSEVKTNFLSIVSHELKTPLTAIRGYSDIIVDNMEDKVAPPVYKMIKSIAKAANRLHLVVNDILDVSRIEQKRLKLSIDKINLIRILKECVEEVDAVTSQRGIQFDLGFPQTFPEVYADRYRIHQVFTNLIGNAVKFSPDGRTINIKGSHDENSVKLCFEDQGIGINKQELGQIFDPFYETVDIRKHSSGRTKFMGGGTGLGLALAKGIITMHGGQIWAESQGMDKEQCPGSCFYIVLPIHPHVPKSVSMQTKADSTATYLKKTPDPEPVQDERRTVLVVDQGQELVHMVKASIGKIFDVVTTSDGGAAVAQAFQFKPAVILVSTKLTGLTGIGICRILKSQPETAGIPVLLFSDQVDKEWVESAYEAGAEDFITKPYGPKELADRIWQVLMTKKSANRY